MVITLTMFALFYAILDGPIQLLLDTGAQHSTSAKAATGRSYAELAWTWAPFVVLSAAGLALLARAVWESALPR